MRSVPPPSGKAPVGSSSLSVRLRSLGREYAGWLAARCAGSVEPVDSDDKFMDVILPVWTRAANQEYTSHRRLCAAALAVTVYACTQTAQNQVASVAGDSTSDSARTERERPNIVPVLKLDLPPLADSIASRLTLIPTTQSTFVVALHDRKLLVDLGRVDDNVSKTPERLAAYRAAVEARSPVEKGARLHVRGPWGMADATIESFGTWSGRVVGVLAPNPSIDSTLKSSTPLVGLAERTSSVAGAPPNVLPVSAPTATPDANPPPPGTAAIPTTAATGTTGGTASPTATAPPAQGSLPHTSTAPNADTSHSAASCSRAWDDATRARASSVRDSLERVLRAGDQPVYPRLLSSLKTKRSMIPGCFPGGKALIAVALYGGDFEWVREKIVLLTNGGGVRTIPVRDYRMRAHELLDAFDADDNGTDDIAARGFTNRAGAQVVLRFTENRLERIAAGFAWER